MIIKPLNDLKLINTVIKEKKSVKAYLVGGCVRDWYLGRKCFDIDITFSEYPLEIAKKIAKRFNLKLKEHPNFLTISIYNNKRRIDFATFRKETYTHPAALPQVKKAESIEEDLKRRDFTTNALALSLNENRFNAVDIFNSIKDIEKGIIRVLHDKSFIDDPTRIFRAIRFAKRFNWKIEEKTYRLIKRDLNYIKLLSKERIRNELIKILKEKKCYKALTELKKLGIIGNIIQIKFDRRIDMLNTLEKRLIHIAIKTNSDIFFKEYNFPKEIKNKISAILIFLKEKKSPLISFEREIKDIIKFHFPAISDYAFKKTFITGNDLIKSGIEKNKIKNLLDKFRKLQFKGKIKNKKNFKKITCQLKNKCY